MKLINKTIKIGSQLSDLDGIKILHISDLHLRGKSKKIENFINKLSKQSFDFLFITGDVVDNREAIKWACVYLKRLKSRYGSWLVLGNHDEFKLGLLQFFAFHKVKCVVKESDLKLFISSLKEIGVKVLLNQSDRIRIGNSSIKITGITIPGAFYKIDPFNPVFPGKVKEFELFFSKQKTEKNEFSILLAHVPDVKNVIKNASSDLFLTGHTHGGQVRIPLIGPVFLFSKFQKKYNRGLFKLPDGSYMNVTAGLGQSRETPIRIFSPPEATLLSLEYRGS